MSEKHQCDRECPACKDRGIKSRLLWEEGRCDEEKGQLYKFTCTVCWWDGEDRWGGWGPPK